VLAALGFFALAGIIWVVADWGDLRGKFGSRADILASYELLRADRAISRTKTWSMRLQSTRTTAPKEWIITEAIIPDREHSWQHEDHAPRIGNLEYIRIGNDRYFRGDAMPDHKAAPEWIKLTPRVTPPVGGWFELRLHLSNPRTIGYSFDSIETTLWSRYGGAHLRPVGLDNYSGHECREWTFTWVIEETGMHMTDTICLGTSDHLPYHITASGGWVEATYEWNPAISIEAPKSALPQPRGFVMGLPGE